MKPLLPLRLLSVRVTPDLETRPDVQRLRANLGEKAAEYGCTLLALSRAGSKEAKVAYKVLQTHAAESPVEWRPTAQWEVDGFGLVALQLLLILWLAREKPAYYGAYGVIGKNLERIDRQTSERWWGVALHLLYLMCRRRPPEKVPALRKLVKSKSCQTARQAHHAIIDALRRRFKSFAPKPVRKKGIVYNGKT